MESHRSHRSIKKEPVFMIVGGHKIHAYYGIYACQSALLSRITGPATEEDVRMKVHAR